MKKRLCHDQTGCQAWENSSDVPFNTLTYSSYYGTWTPSSTSTTVSVPATGTAKLTVNSSTAGIALEVGGLTLSSSSSISNNPSFSFDMPTMNGNNVQVGSWAANQYSHGSFSQKKITSTCLQALSSGRVYASGSTGQYVEYSASIYGTFNAPTPPTTPTTPTNTVFDPSWCSGSNITKAETLSKFQPAATTATLGTVTLEGRKRECQDQTGCLGWQPTTSLPFNVLTYSSYYGTWTPSSTSRSITTPSTGKAILNATSNTISIALGLDDYPGLSLSSSSSFSNNPSWSFDMPTLDGSNIQVGSWAANQYSHGSFSQKKVTNHCLQALSTGRVYSENGKYTEYNASFHSTY